MSIAVSIRPSLILLLYSLGWSTHFITAQEASITIPPRAVNASINAVAEFTCTAVGSTFTWNSNGQQLEYGNETGIDIKTKLLQNGVLNIRKSTLRFTVTSTDNATNITCFVVSLSPITNITFVESHPVLLIVQGLLESVSNFTVVSINSTTVLISWIPPFTLEGVPILGYNVTITNTTSGENETMSVEGDTTMLYYSIDHPDPNSNFTVTVIPINGAGPGENVTKRFLFPIDELMPSVVRTTPLPSTNSVSTTVSTNDITTVSVTALGPPTITPATTTIPSIPTFTFNDTIIIIGAVIGGLVIVIITTVVVVAVVVWKRSRSRNINVTTVQQTKKTETTEYTEQALELTGVRQTHSQSTLNSTTVSNSRIPDDSGIVSDNSMEVTTSFSTSEPVKEENGKSPVS